MKTDQLPNKFRPKITGRISSRLPLAFLIAFGFASVAVLAGCGHKSAGGDVGGSSGSSAAPLLPSVETSTARLGSIEETLPVSAVLRALPNQEAIVSPSVAGIVDSVNVTTGARVAKGQIIARLSTRLIEGQIEQAKLAVSQSEVQGQQAEANVLQQEAQAKAGIAQAQSALLQAKAALMSDQAALISDQAAVKNAEQNYQRLQKLEKDGIAAKKDVEAAELALQTAQAQAASQNQTIDAQNDVVASQASAVEAAKSANIQTEVKRKDVKAARIQVQTAKAALLSAQNQLALYTLRSPLSGVVSSIGASAGESVDASAKIAVVSNVSVLQMQISVPADSAPKVRPGQLVRFWSDSLPGKTFSAVIRSVGSEVDSQSNAIQALASVSNDRRLFSDGLFVRAQIVLAARARVCLVPKSAILRDASGEESIDITGNDSTIHVRNVVSGLSDGTNVEVVSGVRPGELIVSSGGYGLPDGSKAQIEKGGSSK